MNDIISFDALRQAVRDAARSAFEEIRGKYPDDAFYSYSLYTDDGAYFLYAAAGSEENLHRVFKKYNEKKNAYESLEDWRYTADAEYMVYGEEHFGTVTKLLNRATSYDDMDDDQAEVQVGKLMTAIVQGFRDLDEEGFFGTGIERDDITLFIAGDLDLGFMCNCVEQLNPPNVAERFIKLHETETWGAFVEIGSRLTYEMKGVAVTRNGSVLAAAGDSHLFTFDVPSYQETFKQRISGDRCIWCCALSPDAERFAIGWQSGSGEEGGIECWPLTQMERLHKLPVLQGGVWTIDFSPDSQLLASGGHNAKIHLWNTATGELLREFEDGMQGVHCVRFSPDGRLLASIDRNPSSLRLWDVATGARIALLEDHGAQISFSPDGRVLAAVSGGVEMTARDVRLWNVETRKLERRIEGLEHETTAVAISRNGRLLATGSTLPGNVELWDLENGQRLLHLIPNYECINGLAFIDEQQTLAVVGHPSMNRPPLLLWDFSEAFA